MQTGDLDSGLSAFRTETAQESRCEREIVGFLTSLSGLAMMVPSSKLWASFREVLGCRSKMLLTFQELLHCLHQLEM